MSAVCPCCGLASPSSTAVGLTEVQRRVLQYLEQCASETRVPSYEEIAHAIGRKSKGAICTIIDRLEKRGHVRRLRGVGHARSIIVLGSFPRRIAA
jgi:DNA-binding MarR family transcriptional regulator